MNNFEITNEKSTDTPVAEEISLLVIIVDTNPGQRMLRELPHILTQSIDSLIAFGNAHLMQKAQNKLAMMACHSKTSEFIYPKSGKPLDIRQVDGQYEVFTLVEKTVKQNLSKLLHSETSVVVTESLLAGAIAMALCYIARILRIKAPGSKLNSRILVVTGSTDSASQYMNYMNVFFTAQKQNIAIDVCALDQHLSLLQQGCDITGGLYLRIPQIQGLLQYLLAASTALKGINWERFPNQFRLNYEEEYPNLSEKAFRFLMLFVTTYLCETEFSILSSKINIRTGLDVEPDMRIKFSPDLKFLCNGKHHPLHSWVFLPEPPIRQKLVLPPPVKVDYRAACFCHRELIDIGYVCSVCLSIFCKFSPICTTCHTVFKIPGPLAVKTKKKKIKM